MHIVWSVINAIHHISRPHETKNRQCLPELSGSGLQLQLNSQMDGYKIMHRAWSRMRSVLLFFRIIHQISRSDVAKNYPFSSYLSVSGWYLYFEFTGGYQMTHVAFMDMEEVFRCFEVFCQISMSHGPKNDDFPDLDPIWAILLGRSQLSNSPDLPCSLLTIKHTFCPRPYISFNQYRVWQDVGKHCDATSFDDMHICLTHIIATR